MRTHNVFDNTNAVKLLGGMQKTPNHVFKVAIGFCKAFGHQNVMISNKGTREGKPEVKEGAQSRELGANKTAKKTIMVIRQWRRRNGW